MYSRSTLSHSDAVSAVELFEQELICTTGVMHVPSIKGHDALLRRGIGFPFAAHAAPRSWTFPSSCTRRLRACCSNWVTHCSKLPKY